MHKLPVETRRHDAWTDRAGRCLMTLTVLLAIAAAPAAAQADDEADDGLTTKPAGSVAGDPAARPAAAEDRDYVIPFMVLTDIDTDFSLAPPSGDDVLHDTSQESIDAMFDRRQANR